MCGWVGRGSTGFGVPSRDFALPSVALSFQILRLACEGKVVKRRSAHGGGGKVGSRMIEGWHQTGVRAGDGAEWVRKPERGELLRLAVRSRCGGAEGFCTTGSGLHNGPRISCDADQSRRPVGRRD